MLHHEFKIEIFKRYLQNNPDKWDEIALETFQFLLNLHYEYELLYHQSGKLNNISKLNKLELPCFDKQNDLTDQLNLHQNLLECKFVLAIQELEEIQLKNQELQNLIKKIGLTIIEFLPKISKQMADKYDTLIDKIVEK